MMILYSVSIFFFLLAEISSEFTCQGDTYNQGLQACPDDGTQQMSAGGNVTILVKKANNLPDKDTWGPSAGVSDPYVRFIVGDDINKKTKTVRNNLNPTWNEYVSLGFLGSATQIRIEIWDDDSGLEFNDVKLASGSVRVPFCSTFNASYVSVDCGEPFNCEADDSLWAMPSRQRCHETGSVLMSGTTCTNGICLELEIFLVPFTMEVELEYSDLLTESPQLTAAADRSSALWTVDFGKPFIGSSSEIDTDLFQFSVLNGALMFRMSNDDRSLGTANAIRFYVGTNFPCTFYVCRYQPDNEIGVPTWLNSYEDRFVNIRELRLTGEDELFGCFIQDFGGTEKNKWGGIIGEAYPFRTNTLEGLDSNSAADQGNYVYNYIIIAVPVAEADREDSVNITYDAQMFLSLFGSYGLICFWFMYLVGRFLKKIDYRLDRLTAYAASRGLTGHDRSLIAGLYVAYGTTPMNVHYRGHLYHTRNILAFIIFIPMLLLLSWGLACSSVVQPPALGFGLAFGGISALFLWYGMKLWEVSKWRVSPIVVTSMIFSLLFFLIFLLTAIFHDPVVIQLKGKIDFTALSLVFAVINCIPLLLLAFKQDRSQIVHLQQVVQKLAEAVYVLRNQVVTLNMVYKDLKVNKLLHALLGDNYTINPHVPAFKLSAVLFDVNGDATPASAVRSQQKENNKEKHDGKDTVEGGEGASSNAGRKPLFDRQKFDDAHKLYYGSIVTLMIYLTIAAVETTFPSLAFLNCLTLILLDAIHLSMSHGDTKWSPGFMIALIIAGRVLIMGSPPSLWILNYSACYVVYGVILLRAMINGFLPILSATKAGELAFAGGEVFSAEHNPDLAGTSFFSLGLLTFAFSAISIIAAFGDADSELPTPELKVFGMEGWHPSVFGLIAVLFIVITGLLVSTYRAFYMDRHGLLRGKLQEVYLLRTEVKLPLMLAIFSEVAIVVGGLLIFLATGSVAVLVGALWIPIIVVMLGSALKIWIQNDYDLVVWPRPKYVNSDFGGPFGHQGDPSDLEVAFNMIEDLFGGPSELDLVENIEADEEKPPPVKTLKGFQLPPMTTSNEAVTEIKMPPLPLKSVLRRKRQNMGIKTKTPLIKDLRTREDAVDHDKFGNSDDVIDASDPWAQFEDLEDQENEEKYIKRRKAVKSLENNGLILLSFCSPLAIRRKLKKWYQFFCGKGCAALCSKKSKVHPKKSADKYISEEGGEDKEGETLAIADKEKVKPSDKLGKLTAREGETEMGDKEEPEDEEEEEEEEKVIDLDSMPFSEALWDGHLNRSEYIALTAWYGGMLSILLFGTTLSLTVSPLWIGQVIWVAAWMFILTLVPMVKYFNTYTFDSTMRNLMKFAVTLHCVFCLVFFVVGLNADAGLEGSLWLMNYFVYYPIFMYVIFEFYRWYDRGFVIMDIDQDHDGRISCSEFFDYMRAAPVLIAMTVLFNFQLYIYVDFTVGQVTTILLIIWCIGYFYIRDWALNEHFLSPELRLIADYAILITIVVSFIVAVVEEANPLFAISVFCFALALKFMVKVIGRVAVIDRDTVVYFSPFVFPVFSYDSKKQDITNESFVVLYIFYTLIVGIVWGAFMAMFFSPIHIGVALSCCFILAIAAFGALAASYVPVQLAKSAAMLQSDIILDAANAAKEKFVERHDPVNLDMPEWEEDFPTETAPEKPKEPLQKLIERSALENAVEQMNSLRSLKYVKEERQVLNLDDDEDELEQPWIVQIYVSIRNFIKDFFEVIPIHKMNGWKKHNQHIFSFTSGMMELFITGRGPFGVLAFEGIWYKILQFFKYSPRLEKLYPTALDNYDEHGNSLKNVELVEDLDFISVFHKITLVDKAIDVNYEEETRCAIHFLLMLIIGSDAKLQRERVLFQKFLRENRFRLASNGISPPKDIFSGASYASINIPLVAAWLVTLSGEERERFHMLKATFSEEQRERDEQIDNSDYEIAFNAQALYNERKTRDQYWRDIVNLGIMKRKEIRVQNFLDGLQGIEKNKFLQRQDLWLSDPECYVDLKEMDLYNRFREDVMSERNEALDFIQSELEEREAAQVDARLGEYGRSYQYVDSEFPPSDVVLGELPESVKDSILGWRCAPGIREEVQLFDGGTHPDEIEAGVFNDEWLLSAINMIVAAGVYGNGLINEQIHDLFIQHAGADGEFTLQTDVGAYCLQIFRNSEWIPILVDDLLPMLKKDMWRNENRGMACAHNKESHGIWVSLIEKMYAKFLGSYGELSRGYVQHALQELTGCEAECITLSSASRGIGKTALWNNLLRYRKNGYILGAGTGDSTLADKEILEMGIIFNAAYTIYDIKCINGHRLLKLRNPPGDHEEWKGDWSDKSPLWNKKLKAKFGHSDADDNTFFMSFDDFCNVFRNLYVCRYYSLRKWKEKRRYGVWKRSDESAIEEMELKNQFLREQEQALGIETSEAQVESQEELNREKAKARVDSAGGLPSKHNPGCMLENNPHYSLIINRPTDLRITVTQYDRKGSNHVENHPVPFSIFLVKNSHPTIPQRLEVLNRTEIVESTGVPQTERTLHLYASSLAPGLYVVLVGAYLRGMEGRFKISVLSNYRLEFSAIWPPQWVLRDERFMEAEDLGKTQKPKQISTLKRDRSANFFRKGIRSILGTGDEFDDDDDDEDGVHPNAVSPMPPKAANYVKNSASGSYRPENDYSDNVNNEGPDYSTIYPEPGAVNSDNYS